MATRPAAVWRRRSRRKGRGRGRPHRTFSWVRCWTTTNRLQTGAARESRDGARLVGGQPSMNCRTWHYLGRHGSTAADTGRRVTPLAGRDFVAGTTLYGLAGQPIGQHLGRSGVEFCPQFGGANRATHRAIAQASRPAICSDRASALVQICGLATCLAACISGRDSARGTGCAATASNRGIYIAAQIYSKCKVVEAAECARPVDIWTAKRRRSD